MENANERPVQGMRPWMRVMFALSVALNLLVVGVVVGSQLAWGGKDRGPGARLEQMGGSLTRALSPRDRHEIGREMRRTFGKGGVARADKRAAMEALVSDLRAEPFDRETIAGHLARQRAVLNERMTFGQGLVLERIEQMSSEERAAFADRLEDKLKRGKKSQ